ncbi:MAG TPA: hypothetical protein VGB45_04175, partial [Abditibacterium sp.]
TRRGLYLDWRRAMDADEDDPLGAIALLDATIARARNSGDAWWPLFLEHWKLQILLNKARDFEAALDCAARATVEARQPKFGAFPQRICLHEDLITAYQGLDPVGFAPLIQGALDYMEREIAPGVECAACHRGLCAEFMRSTSQTGAVDSAWQYLAFADARDEDFHRAQAYLQLCFSLATLETETARQRMSELANLGYEFVQKAKYSEGLHEILMWQALGAQWSCDANSKRAFLRAIESRKRYGAAARPGYFYAGTLFYEALGDWEGALKWIDEELLEIEGKGEWWRETTRRAKKCEILRQMGLDFSIEAQKVRELAAKLKSPGTFAFFGLAA